MDETLSLITRLIPEAGKALDERLRMLKNIHSFQPIGRRMLSHKVALTERVIRTEIEAMKHQGLVMSTSKGMELTQEGEQLLSSLLDLAEQQGQSERKADQLAKKLGIRLCSIVPGDADHREERKEKIGQRTAALLSEYLPEGQCTIGVMGGTTMAETAAQLTHSLSYNRSLVFVPARGGLSESLEIQANAVCEEMARRTGGENQVLYVPEQVSPLTQRILSEEPAIRQALDLLHSADCVLFSISDALSKAKRRNTSPTVLKRLEEEAAVGEAFGDYYDKQGKTIYRVPQIGMQADQLSGIPLVIGAAGGASKAEAIEAFAKTAPPQFVLVTDEGAADAILNK